jgi:hypothetical protein
VETRRVEQGDTLYENVLTVGEADHVVAVFLLLLHRGSQTYTDADGNKYWKEKIKWWDLSLNAMFNLTRLIGGYEGINSSKHLNQFIASIGIGATHHYDLPYGSVRNAKYPYPASN